MNPTFKITGLLMLAGFVTATKLQAQTNQPVVQRMAMSQGSDRDTIRKLAAILTFPDGWSSLLGEDQQPLPGPSDTYVQFIQSFPHSSLVPEILTDDNALTFQSLDELAENSDPQRLKLVEEVRSLVARNLRLNLGDKYHGGGELSVGQALRALAGANDAAASLGDDIDRAVGPSGNPYSPNDPRYRSYQAEHMNDAPYQSDTAQKIAEYNSTLSEINSEVKRGLIYSGMVIYAREHLYANAANVWEKSLLPRLTDAAGPVVQEPLAAFGRVCLREGKKEIAVAAFGNPKRTLHNLSVRIRLRSQADEKLDWYGWYPALAPKTHIVIVVQRSMLNVYSYMKGEISYWCDEGQNVDLSFDTATMPQLDRGFHLVKDSSQSESPESYLERTGTPGWKAARAKYEKIADTLDLVLQDELIMDVHPFHGREKLVNAFSKGQVFSGEVQGQLIVSHPRGRTRSLVPDLAIPHVAVAISCQPFDLHSTNIFVTIKSGSAKSYRANMMKGTFYPFVKYGSVIGFSQVVKPGDTNSSPVQARMDGAGSLLYVDEHNNAFYRTPVGSFPLKLASPASAQAPTSPETKRE